MGRPDMKLDDDCNRHNNVGESPFMPIIGLELRCVNNLGIHHDTASTIEVNIPCTHPVEAMIMPNLTERAETSKVENIGDFDQIEPPEDVMDKVEHTAVDTKVTSVDQRQSQPKLPENIWTKIEDTAEDAEVTSVDQRQSHPKPPENIWTKIEDTAEDAEVTSENIGAKIEHNALIAKVTSVEQRKSRPKPPENVGAKIEHTALIAKVTSIYQRQEINCTWILSRILRLKLYYPVLLLLICLGTSVVAGARNIEHYEVTDARSNCLAIHPLDNPELKIVTAVCSNGLRTIYKANKSFSDSVALLANVTKAGDLCSYVGILKYENGTTDQISLSLRGLEVDYGSDILEGKYDIIAEGRYENETKFCAFVIQNSSNLQIYLQMSPAHRSSFKIDSLLLKRMTPVSENVEEVRKSNSSAMTLDVGHYETTDTTLDSYHPVHPPGDPELELVTADCSNGLRIVYKANISVSESIALLTNVTGSGNLCSFTGKMKHQNGTVGQFYFSYNVSEVDYPDDILKGKNDIIAEGQSENQTKFYAVIRQNNASLHIYLLIAPADGSNFKINRMTLKRKTPDSKKVEEIETYSGRWIPYMYVGVVITVLVLGGLAAWLFRNKLYGCQGYQMTPSSEPNNRVV